MATCRYDEKAAKGGVAVRPNKHINSEAHRSGPGDAKSRYFTTGLPEAHEEMLEENDVPRLELPDSVRRNLNHETASKYDGRGTVGPAEEVEPHTTIDLTHQDWVDPLDVEDEVDLAKIEIDLRQTMREDTPDTYYQRFGTRVPGHR